jgi:hypothetical protein
MERRSINHTPVKSGAWNKAIEKLASAKEYSKRKPSETSGKSAPVHREYSVCDLQSTRWRRAFVFRASRARRTICERSAHRLAGSIDRPQ